ncbi:uncharacterized protein LOC135203626 [Macrobrachium nipponense]|uniref:uncharacterized protein LOC135203626 n=1 Tax=Macrobrachium nipponense TaxID=159736 RepID=UPI0030C89C9B
MDALPQKYMIGEHFLNAPAADQDAPIATDHFFSADQQLLMTATNATEMPNVVGRNPFPMINTDHVYHLNQRTLDLKEISGSTNGLLPIVPSRFVSQDQLAHVSIELPDSENAEEVEEEEFTLDENGPILMIQDALCENDDHNGYIEQGLDEGLREVIQVINENDCIRSVNFVAVESEKSKNPPYMIGDESKIVTKDNEPIKFCLQGAKVNQTVIATLRYTEEKFKNNPVHACKLHRKDDNAFAFILSAAGEEVKQEKDSILEHPTVYFQLQADNLVFDGSFTFYITMLCLNSCHKSDGKRVELVLKVLDGNEERPIKENRFNMRVCRNVKRDFREAFPDGAFPPQKISKPESFLRKRETQDEPVVTQEEAQPVDQKVNVVRMSLPEQKAPEEKVVIRKKRAQPKAPQGNKFYLVQLPTPEIEKNVLQTVKLFGGTILNLETIYPLEESSDDPDVDASP